MDTQLSIYFSMVKENSLIVDVSRLKNNISRLDAPIFLHAQDQRWQDSQGHNKE